MGTVSFIKHAPASKGNSVDGAFGGPVRPEQVMWVVGSTSSVVGKRLKEESTTVEVITEPTKQEPRTETPTTVQVTTEATTERSTTEAPTPEPTTEKRTTTEPTTEPATENPTPSTLTTRAQYTMTSEKPTTEIRITVKPTTEDSVTETTDKVFPSSSIAPTQAEQTTSEVHTTEQPTPTRGFSTIGAESTTGFTPKIGDVVTTTEDVSFSKLGAHGRLVSILFLFLFIESPGFLQGADTLPNGTPIKTLPDDFRVYKGKDDFSPVVANNKGIYILHPVQRQDKQIIFDPFTIGQVLGYLYEKIEFGNEKPPGGKYTIELMGGRIPTKRFASNGKTRRASLIFTKKNIFRFDHTQFSQTYYLNLDLPMLGTLPKVWLTYGIISAIFMILLIVLLSKNKHFTFSFYRLITMDLLLNLCCWLNTWPNRMIFRQDGVEYILPIYENVPSVIYITYFIMNIFLHVQSISSISICIHRLSTSLFKSSNSFWSKYYLLVYALTLVYSFGATQLVHLNEVEFDYQSNTFKLSNVTVEQIEANRVYLRFFISGYLLIIIIIGSLTIFKVKQRLDNQSLQHKLLLRKMSQITITHTCVYAILLIWQIVSPFLIYNNSINILMTVSDMIAFSMAYILILFDGNVRAAIINKIPFTAMIKGRVTDIQSTQNNSSRVIVM
ncbi:CRE-SRG-50 protein [Caenorhabditis remanei]|uniref:Serpentine receptor class gamma n=1 Tax=Caenorhabditis remanei TaxID=31234 RepID=E3M722_CAERE|nr:CRE-SRG-50 protein [Caenorhabditis remanei]